MYGCQLSWHSYPFGPVTHSLAYPGGDEPIVVIWTFMLIVSCLLALLSAGRPSVSM